jgi:hypothetical protein
LNNPQRLRWKNGIFIPVTFKTYGFKPRSMINIFSDGFAYQRAIFVLWRRF